MFKNLQYKLLLVLLFALALSIFLPCSPKITMVLVIILFIVGLSWDAFSKD